MTSIFVEQTGTANPLNGIDAIGSNSAPTFADIDADGDLDVIIGGYYGGLVRYYKNTGSATAPVYTADTIAINGGYTSCPTFADIDGDGDLDALVGSVFGELTYFKNTGTATAPAYALQVGTANPFNGINVIYTSAPTFADIDGDGDLDAIIGQGNGILRYYKNTGTATAPIYVEQTVAANPFNGIDVGSLSTPTLADIDGDGDLDAIVGASDGTLKYYKNTGSRTAPAYTVQTGTANPFNGIDVGAYSAPTFADIDGDGDLDAIVGAGDGTLRYYKNISGTIATAYVEQTGTANPFNGIDVGFASTPTLADLDGDGDLDAIIGEFYGSLRYYKNTGNATNPVYTVQTGTANPFNGIDIGSFNGPAPTLADLDSDGDLDAVIGTSSGTFYYKNTGNATNPVYTVQTGTANPFNNIVVVGNGLTLADIDGDGDLDAIVGEFYGSLKYYKNTGTATAPVYVEQTGTANPFNGIDIGFFSKPTFADIDKDGDLDAIIGTSSGTLRYYKNTGTATNPVYTAQTGTANPFNGIDVGASSAPTFADIDGDGDLDVIVGESNGTIKYFASVAVNSPPTALSLTNPKTAIAENTSTVTRLKVADIAIADDGLGTNNLSVSGTDASFFEVDATGLYLKANTNLDFEIKSSYSITVSVDDPTLGNTPDASVNYILSITNVSPENLVATPATDQFNLGVSDDSLTSTFSNLQQTDNINAGNGIDTLILSGGTSIDNLKIDASNSSNQLNIAGTTITNFERFDLSGFLGTVSFNGFNGNNWIQSGAGNDNLTGNSGNDYLNGGTGADQLLGLQGNDAYVVDNTGDVIIEGLNAGIDSVAASITWTLKANLENLTLTGTTAINGTGNSLANVIVGNSANNRLNGDAGNDTLTGGAGNDTLIGGAGNDILIGGNGKDFAYYYSSTASVTVNLATGTASDGLGGTDTLSQIENVQGSNTAVDNLTGNTGVNALYGYGGADILTGGGSNDLLYLGSDTVTDTVNYTNGDGADTVYNFVRGAGGDLLKFTGISAIDVQVSGTSTLFKVGDGISGNSGFGTGTLLLTTSATSGFVAADVNVNLLGATFAFS